MRPTSRRESTLRSPLNDILGTEANVRLLRVLSRTTLPMSATEIARQAAITLSGVGRALGTLEQTGIIEFVGVGRRRPVQLRRAHPLAPVLEELFAAEARRVTTIFARIRAAAETLTPTLRSVWVEGPVARGTDRADDPVVVGVLAGAKELDATVEALVVALTPLEIEEDITIEVRGRTAADLAVAVGSERQELDAAVLLLGPPPLALVGTERAREAANRGRAATPVSHAVLDERARVLGAAVAAKLGHDPSLVERARSYIAQRLLKASPGERRELQEWDRILRTMSLPRLRRFLVEPSERATRLRQSLPFVGVLTPAEREREAAVENTHALAPRSSARPARKRVGGARAAATPPDTPRRQGGGR
jgi:hypothetical protein